MEFLMRRELFMKSLTKIFVILFILLLISGFISSQDDVVIYYPTPYEYPDTNVLQDDLHLTDYYGRSSESDYSETAVGSDSGLSGTAVEDDDVNPVGVFDKIFSKDSGEIAGDEFIRAYSKIFFVNGIPDISYITIWLDNYLLSDKLGYSRVTQPVEIQPGKVPFIIEISGVNIIEGDLNLQAGKEHIIFLTGLHSVTTGANQVFPEKYQITARMITEDPLIDMSMAGISFFNAAPVATVGALDLRLGPSGENMGKLFTGQGYGQYSNTLTVPPGKYYIDLIESASNKEMTLDLMVNLTAGKKFFAVAFAPPKYGLSSRDDEMSLSDYKIFELE